MGNRGNIKRKGGKLVTKEKMINLLIYLKLKKIVLKYVAMVNCKSKF